jgi:hypothetical protein
MDITRIAQEVLEFVAAEKIELSEDLNAVEVILREQVLRIGARALELHLAGRKLGYEGSSRACECGANQKFVNHRPRTLATLLGPVTYRRAYYHCKQCGASALPYDQKVGLGRCQQSVGLAKAAVELNKDEPCRSAAGKLASQSSQRLSASTVLRLGHKVGTVAALEEQKLAERMEKWDAPPAEDHPRELYMAVDGAMGPRLDGWHEVRAACCYWDEPDGTRRSRYVVRWGQAEAFVPFVWSLGCRCGWVEAERKILQGDGARWIWDHVGGVLDDAIHETDWYHAMEHVWACGRALFGQGTDQTKAWVKAKENLLWEGQGRQIVAEVLAERKQHRSPGKREALQSLVTYLNNQGDRLAYDRFRAMGLHIGSGVVESSCKHLVNLRLKRGGMRWSIEGSQAILSLRSAWLNGDWEALWARHPLTDSRIHLLS